MSARVRTVVVTPAVVRAGLLGGVAKLESAPTTARTPGSGSVKTGSPASRCRQASASQGARSSGPIGQGGSAPSQGRGAKSTGSKGRQRPPQRLEVPPSRRAAAVAGVLLLAVCAGRVAMTRRAQA